MPSYQQTGVRPFSPEKDMDGWDLLWWAGGPQSVARWSDTNQWTRIDTEVGSSADDITNSASAQAKYEASVAAMNNQPAFRFDQAGVTPTTGTLSATIDYSPKTVFTIWRQSDIPGSFTRNLYQDGSGADGWGLAQDPTTVRVDYVSGGSLITGVSAGWSMTANTNYAIRDTRLNTSIDIKFNGTTRYSNTRSTPTRSGGDLTEWQILNTDRGSPIDGWLFFHGIWDGDLSAASTWVPFQDWVDDTFGLATI